MAGAPSSATSRSGSCRGGVWRLVGGNGVGKTTILEIIVGDQEADSGEVHSAKGTRIGYLPQELTEQVDGIGPRGGHAGRRSCHRPRGADGAACSTTSRPPAPGGSAEDDEAHEQALHAYGEAQHRFESLGGYGIEAEARRVLAGLGLPLRRHGPAGAGALGGMAHAGGARPAHALRTRSAGSRRAHQPPRRRVRGLAGAVSGRLARRHPLREPRPRLHRRGRRAGDRGVRRPGSRVRRRVRRVRGAARGAPGADSGRRRPSSSDRSSTSSSSSTGSATRRPRPARCRAGSRCWTGSTASRFPIVPHRQRSSGSPSPSAAPGW